MTFDGFGAGDERRDLRRAGRGRGERRRGKSVDDFRRGHQPRSRVRSNVTFG